MRDQAEQIVWQFRELLDALDDAAGVQDLAAKRQQLDGLTKAIQTLDAGGILVPEELRQKRADLVEEVGPADEAEQTLAYLRNEVGSLAERLGKPGNSRQRRPTGPRSARKQTTHRNRLRELIMEALCELGGSARTRDVLDRITAKLNGQLQPGDIETRQGGELVWRNNARFERFRMIQDGLLKADSPQGMWELARGR